MLHRDARDATVIIDGCNSGAPNTTFPTGSNGTSVELRARINRKLVEGVARVAEEHAGDLHPAVEVLKS
jgi:hypothetical protein